MEMEVLFDIGAYSQEFWDMPEIQFDKRDVLVIYPYALPSGKYKRRAIRFVDTLMCKVTKDEISESGGDAYDHVAQVINSELLAKIRKERPKTLYGRNTADYNHYIVYFDDIGMYEFIARDAKPDFIET